jgi:bifunctional UDP-N-acetylglucosamine pyrophosphorylase/glucosamine-1-phosphate N-acetyltransferase
MVAHQNLGLTVKVRILAGQLFCSEAGTGKKHSIKMAHKNVAAIILAAGVGTRMKSRLAKVLHPLCGRPMLGYVLDLVKDLKISKSVPVLGYNYQEIKKLLGRELRFAIQRRPLGTADAVRRALPLLRNFRGTILILYADAPLLKKETLEKLLKHHAENNLDATLLSAKVDNPVGYGRVLRDKYANISGVREDKDADDFEKEIKEVNTGIVCFKKESLVKALKYVKANNRKKEYYLTDTIGIIYKNGGLVDSLLIGEADEAMGINSRLDLSRANSIMQKRINDKLMNAGVTIVDPGSTFISWGSQVGEDSVIYPFTVIERDVKIGKSCSIGPFAHIKTGTILKDEVVAGNFIEIVRSRVAAKTWIKHFGYIGDSRIGAMVNVGAGCVTANFDGLKKHTTVIGDKAFIGSDTILVAPVRVGRAAKTGAGSVVTKNSKIAAGSTVVGVPARPLKKKSRGSNG